MGFYHDLNKEGNHYRGVFLIVSVLTVGLCSMFPMMCFKNYSSKERAKKKQELKDLERRARRRQEELGIARPVSRRHSLSPPRTAHAPHSHHRRRHSTVTPRDRHDTRGRRFREEDIEVIQMTRSPRQPRSRYRYDQQLDRERQERHHGNAPPRRYHHSSWEEVLKPMPTF